MLCESCGSYPRDQRRQQTNEDLPDVVREVFAFCAPGRSRTRDPNVRPLCSIQLSYRGTTKGPATAVPYRASSWDHHGARCHQARARSSCCAARRCWEGSSSGLRLGEAGKGSCGAAGGTSCSRVATSRCQSTGASARTRTDSSASFARVLPGFHRDHDEGPPPTAEALRRRVLSRHS